MKNYKKIPLIKYMSKKMKIIKSQLSLALKTLGINSIMRIKIKYLIINLKIVPDKKAWQVYLELPKANHKA